MTQLRPIMLIALSIVFALFLILLSVRHTKHFASFAATPNASIVHRYVSYLAQPWTALSARDNARSRPSQCHDDYYTAEERLYFTTGQGDRKKHQARLMQYIRQQLVRPSGRVLPERGTKGDPSQVGQSTKLDVMMNGRRNGFFIECGAVDGLWLSNTLFFETMRNWTGLLVEANPDHTAGLLNSGRNSFRLTTCLSTATTPSAMVFDISRVTLVISPGSASDQRARQTNLVCLPLEAILDALSVTHVDLLSLDTDGAEINILRTINYTRIEIDYIMVEYAYSMPRFDEFEAYFVKELGLYELATTFPSPKTVGQDAVFRRKQKASPPSTI